MGLKKGNNMDKMCRSYETSMGLCKKSKVLSPKNKLPNFILKPTIQWMESEIKFGTYSFYKKIF